MKGHALSKTILLLFLCVGCSDYQGISPTAYQYAKALYSVTNRQRTEKLERVSDLITESQQQGEITSQEAAWLEGIIDDAREGEWQTAQREARRMMDDQVE